MMSSQKARIEENSDYLGYCITPEIKRLVGFLSERKIILPDEKEDILDEISDTLKSETLLDHILKKDDSAFENLYDASLRFHLWKAADILKPENGPHLPSEETVELLPEMWPMQRHLDVMKVPQRMTVERVGSKQTQMLHDFKESAQESDSIYNMSQRVRGRVLIIINDKFDSPEIPNRPGASYEKAGLEHIFSHLGFEINAQRNLDKEKMFIAMETEKSRLRLSHNCFFIIILSRGGNGYAFGTDGRVENNSPVNVCHIEDIKKRFSMTANLVNKPKVLIIEAQPCTAEAHTAIRFGSEPLAEENFDFLKENVENVDLNNIEGDGPGDSAPASSDVFEIVSTSGDIVRDEQEIYGSWFCQALIYMIANYAHKLDLASLVVKINELDGPCKTAKEVCKLKATVNKSLFLFPGLPLVD